MPKDTHDRLLERLAAEGRAGGLIVRCDAWGVLCMMHPRHAQEKDQQANLTLHVEDRQEGRHEDGTDEGT